MTPLGHWADNARSAVAWDAVESYLIFESAEDCAARRQSHQESKQARAQAAAAADRPRDGGSPNSAAPPA